jgi:hypothetical protein
MQKFHLVRKEDESGVSGVGIVAEGVIFSSGKVAMTWLTDLSSTAFYESIFDVEKIHGHQGKTKIVFEDHDSYEPLNPKTIYEVGYVENGWYVREHNQQMVVGAEDTADSDVHAFELFLRSITNHFGPNTSRYSPERLTICKVPGDKCENAGLSFSSVYQNIFDHLDYLYRFLINIKESDLNDELKSIQETVDKLYDKFSTINLK